MKNRMNITWGNAAALMLAAVLLTGCGDSPLQSMGSGPSTVTAPTTSGVAGTFKPQYVQGVNSCPDGELVRNIRVSVNRGGTALIQWDEVASIREYVVRIARYQTGVTEVTNSVKQSFLKVHMSDSTYIVYVKTQNDCGGFGPEGEGVVFSIDGPDAPVIVPPVIIIPPVDPPPPVVCENGDHNNDGHCDSGDNGNPPENPGDGNGGGNGNGGGGGNPGNGGDPQGPPVNPGPPAFVDVALCHAEFHAGHGGEHPVASYYTYQDKTAHSQAELDQHIGQHENDYLGACQQ